MMKEKNVEETMQMQRKLYIVIITALFALTASVAGAADKTSDQLVKEAKAAIKEVTPTEGKQMIDANEKIILLDVRDKEEFETGCIPGAINISRGVLEFKVNMAIPDKNARIIVYCGIDLRGPLATKTLNELGYKNAVNISGGLKAWKEAGYPITK